MTFDKLIEAALAAPPGSIMFATVSNKSVPALTENEEAYLDAYGTDFGPDFEFVAINGQKPAEA
jgi:hypothetical protein